MEYIVLFFTQSGAIKFEKIMNSKGLDCILLPVPRKLSSSCGISVKFNYTGDISELIINDIDKIYKLVDNKYNLVYKEEE